VAVILAAVVVFVVVHRKDLINQPDSLTIANNFLVIIMSFCYRENYIDLC